MTKTRLINTNCPKSEWDEFLSGKQFFILNLQRTHVRTFTFRVSQQHQGRGTSPLHSTTRCTQHQENSLDLKDTFLLSSHPCSTLAFRSVWLCFRNTEAAVHSCALSASARAVWRNKAAQREQRRFRARLPNRNWRPYMGSTIVSEASASFSGVTMATAPNFSWLTKNLYAHSFSCHNLNQSYHSRLRRRKGGEGRGEKHTCF